MMDLGWITRSSALQLPLTDRDAIALSFEDEEHLSYGELHQLQNRFANGLLALGVEHGDRVGILMRNCSEYLPLHFAIARIGATTVRLNFRLTAPELQFALADSGCKVLCLEPEFVERIEQVAAEIPTKTTVLFGDMPSETELEMLPATELSRHGDADPGVPTPSGEDRLMLMYTSGTTGFPKAAVWTHNTAIGCGVSQAIELGHGPDTVAMTTGPLYHAGAFETLLLSALLAGGRGITLGSGHFDVERVVEIAREAGVTDIFLFPFMIYDLLKTDEIDGDLLPSLRRIVTGGDPIAPWALKEAARRFPDGEIVQAYGLTENPFATMLPGSLALEHLGSVGRPLPLREVKVVDEHGVDVPPGEPGEIWIRGAGTVGEYWQRPEETAATFTAGGWLHTGDLGRVTDGMLFIAGRKKDMIRSGGENISPAEVEAVLTAHGDVDDAAVVAIPDAQYTEVGCAVMVVAPGAELDPEQIRAFCRERLAGYKCPKQYVAIAELPRNASGKVLKAQLREQFRHLGSEPGMPGSSGP